MQRARKRRVGGAGDEDQLEVAPVQAFQRADREHAGGGGARRAGGKGAGDLERALAFGRALLGGELLAQRVEEGGQLGLVGEYRACHASERVGECLPALRFPEWGEYFAQAYNPAGGGDAALGDTLPIRGSVLGLARGRGKDRVPIAAGQCGAEAVARTGVEDA